MPDLVKRPLSALVVDDVEVDRIIYVASLKRAGFGEVRFAPDSATAVQIINDRKSNIDLVLMDIELPDVSGLKVCKLIRSVPSCANIPIVVLTSHNDDKHWEQAFEAGVDDYLVKPIKHTKWRFLVRMATSLRKLRELDPKMSEVVVAAPSNAGTVEALVTRYAYELKSALERHNINGGTFSVLLMQPMMEGIPHKKVQKILRAVLLSAVYQSVRMLNRDDGEFLIVLPEDDIIRAKAWLSQIRDAMMDIAREVTHAGSAIDVKPVFRYGIASLRDGEILSAQEVMQRLADSISEERHGG